MKKKATIRDYMELLRDLSNNRGRTSLKRAIEKHGITQAATVTLKKLNYVDGQIGPSGAQWVGPRFTNESELREHAERLKMATKEYARGYAQAKAPAPRQQQAAVPTRVWIAQPPPQVVINPKPSATATPKAKPKRRKRVSILWGLISWG